MDEIIKALLSLPSLTLEEPEWQACQEILRHPQIQSGSDFKIALENEIFLHYKDILKPNSIISLSYYLDACHNLKLMLATQYKIFAIAWWQVTKNDITADDLVALMIELLPHSLKELESLRTILETATNVYTSNETGYILIQLLLAVSAKILFMKDESNTLANQVTEKFKENVQQTISKIAGESHLNQLRHATVIYQEHIHKEIISHIDALHYEDQLRFLNKETKIAEEIFKEIQQGSCSILVNQHHLITYLHTYPILLDIKHNLFQLQPDNQAVIKAFTEQFNSYIHVQSQLDLPCAEGKSNSGGYLSFMGSKSALQVLEEKFFNLANAISELSQQDNSPPLSQESLNTLYSSFNDYEVGMKTKIKSIASSLFYYKNGRLIDKDCFDELIDDIQRNAFSMLVYNEDLLILINKYLILKDMKHSMDSKNDAEFLAKYTHHFVYLHREIGEEELEKIIIPYSFGIQSIYSLFSMKAVDSNVEKEKFIACSDQLMRENPVQDAITTPQNEAQSYMP